MKRGILLITVCILMAAWSSIMAEEAVNNEDIINSDKRIGVEIADEAGVIIDGQLITIKEAIHKAIELNPDIYIAKYNAAMSDSDRMRLDAKYSPVFNAQGGWSSVTNPEMLYLSGNNPKKNDSLKVSASITKAFSTGTVVAAGVGHTSSNLDTGIGATYDVSNPVIFATIEQEFLKNAFGYGDRKLEKILDNASKAQRDAHIYSMSMIVFLVCIDYWNVVIAQNRLDNAKLMLAETKKVRRIVAEKVKIGLSEQFEMNYWNSLVASSNASVAQAEQNYKNVMRKFLRDINDEKAITMQERVVLSDKLPEINSDEAIKKAFEKRVDYLNAERTLENAKLNLQINENKALPSLKGSVSVMSMDYNPDSAGDAYGNVSSMKYPAYEAKVSLTYPLDDTNQKTDERNSNWIVEQSKQNLEKTRRFVKDDVTTKIENINTGYKLYGEAKEARKQAELYYSNMLTNMKRGRFAASSVRDALNALVSCREMELQLLVAYNASLVEFEVSKNELFEKYGVDVEKYIPKEK